MQHMHFCDFSQVCDRTRVTASVDCPLVVWDIAIVFRVSVQSAAENGFHLLSLGSLILKESARS